MTVSNESRPAAVYRLYDAEGTLLYIGSAYDPDHRCKSHRTKEWWPLVARRTDRWFDGRSTAYRMEMEAIAEEDPKYNQFGTPGYTTPLTEAVIRRNADGRVRGRVQAEAWAVYRNVKRDSAATGASIYEASDAADRARMAYLEKSGLFPAYVERRWRRLEMHGY